ncbi:CDP-alcohol phosphatidyltransferase family protein [Sphingomonas fennica]|nr:CDP-alcohol phosphatidyltransferase family protein [Sphingomonas fennica]
MPDTHPAIHLVGENATRIWGMTIDERTRRMAKAAKLPFGDAAEGAPAVLVNRAFVFDPPWLRYHAGQPGAVLTIGGVPVIAHVRDAAERAAVARAMAEGRPLADAGTLRLTAYEDGAAIVNEELRKRETPFAMPLTPATVKAAERASYFGAYKGVTDLLTKYLWPEWALVATRIAARIGMTPNMVTALGAALCVAATIAFWHGHYWSGMAMGLVFMVLDTVDGKLARCTITSSWWGNVFDHGIDLVHPPFWWWAWGVGLTAYGRPIGADTLWTLLAVIVGVYVLQRLVEGEFIRRFGMHIHVWRKVDSDFRLITARRNPNMVVLFVSMLFQRPDIGLIAVAWWTVISFVVHLVQLGQAMLARARGREIRSWLA